MYKVLLDTNILLEYLLTQRPGNGAAQRIMEMTVEEKLTSYVSHDLELKRISPEEFLAADSLN
jgi:predicted nucleic acid-binding protein